MVDFGQATYIDGTVVPGAELRRNTQRDAGDGSGVVRPGDLKVTQMDVPGAGVKVAVGDVLVQSRAPGADRETYGLPLVTAQNYLGDDGAGLPGTGSSVPSGGRRDLVFVEILDPGLPTSYTPVGDWPEGQSAKVSVIQNVPASTRSMADVPALANVTGYELALITYPASTATVTDAMITDLRVLQSPKMLHRPVSFALSGAEVEAVTATSAYPAGGQTWPIQAEVAGQLLVDIPEWATHVGVEVTLYGVRYPGGDAWGAVWLRVGPNTGTYISSQDTRWDSDGAVNASRATLGFADTLAIPESMRGTKQQFRPRATRLGGSDASAARLDRVSSVGLKLTFEQRAV